MKNGIIIDKYGTKRHYLNDMLHREGNLPAVEWKDGTKHYYVNDELHRSDGPAVEGHMFYTYFIHGNLHREDGPAREENWNGKKDWALDGIEYSEKNYWEEIKRRKSLNYILAKIADKLKGSSK